jgi:hypothetical protein
MWCHALEHFPAPCAGQMVRGRGAATHEGEGDPGAPGAARVPEGGCARRELFIEYGPPPGGPIESYDDPRWATVDALLAGKIRLAR